MRPPKKVVARYNRGMAIRPVHRIKHVIDAEGALSDTQSVVDVIAVVDDPSLASVTECETGSKVNGIYLKVECNRTSGTGRSNVYLAVYKNPGAVIAGPDADAVGGSKKKRYVIHQEMVMLGDFVENMPRILFNGVIKIPRGYIRNGPGDKLQVLLKMGGNSVTADFCLQCHYKEFR